MTGRIALALALLTAGCATAQQPVPARGSTEGRTCDGSNLQDFVGRERTPEVEAQILEASGAATIRWVPQGMMVTMEFRPDRVTAYLDAQDRIERISCS